MVLVTVAVFYYSKVLDRSPISTLKQDLVPELSIDIESESDISNSDEISVIEQELESTDVGITG